MLYAEDININVYHANCFYLQKEEEISDRRNLELKKSRLHPGF